MKSLEQVLADWRENATIFRRTGKKSDAELVERFIDEVQQSSAADFMALISEGDAMLRSGHSRSWFRTRRERWVRQGHAEKRRDGWYYRRLIVPSAGTEDAYQEGRRATA